MCVSIYERTMNGFKKLRIPTFVSTEQATEWGSHLNAEQHTVLVKAQRALSYTAAVEPNLQLKVNLATQSKLMREAAGAFALTWAPYSADSALGRRHFGVEMPCALSTRKQSVRAIAMQESHPASVVR